MNKGVAIVIGVVAVGALAALAGGASAAPGQPSAPPAPKPNPLSPVIPPPLVLNLKNQSQPQPTPPTPTPSGPAPSTPLQLAAFNLLQAINGNGYRQSDQDVYRSFQAQAGLTADGFPGTSTMNAAKSALASFGLTDLGTDGYTGDPIVFYPWLSGPGYDGTNAPTAAEWNR